MVGALLANQMALGTHRATSRRPVWNLVSAKQPPDHDEQDDQRREKRGTAKAPGRPLRIRHGNRSTAMPL
jgi:hypothetical protein